MMNGEEFSKKFSRKEFLVSSVLAFLATGFYSCNLISGKRKFPVSFAGAPFKTGHLLRNPNFPAASETIKTDTLIIGGGVSGLSTARFLNNYGFNDWLLLELDDQTGGNSKCGKNKITEYPFGAHYLPVPNEKFTDLLDFLNEHNVITGFDKSGLPIYNEYYLCLEPEERLHYNGVWHEGLPPKTGLLKEDQDDLNRFIAITETYKNQIGSDNLPAFTIPLEWSSKEERFLELDNLSMFDYLQNEKFKSDFLYWYIDYCCRDDYGTGIRNTSAWAGIHYFSSRNGKASNASENEVLTWPEGNNFLVKCLRKNLADRIRTGNLVYKIGRENESWRCYTFEVKSGKSICYEASNVVIATPQFINRRLLADKLDQGVKDFAYYPWLVANITINDKSKLNGQSELSWDNVIYNSGSLGYVNACHQKLDRNQKQTVITWYYNFSKKDAKTEREEVYGKDENYWKEFILNDLKIAHPGIENFIDEIVLYLHGHGMISPSPGFLNSEIRVKLSEGFEGLHFVHSDVSGISLFEQAFYRGTLVAKRLLKKHDITV